MTDIETVEEVTQPVEGFSPNSVPVRIFCKNNKKFIVDDVDAWGYMELGVFATGHWDGYSGEIDVLIPYDSVHHYELDFGRLKKFLQALADGQAAANPPQEEAPQDESPSA